jgi:hypothetical protein
MWKYLRIAVTAVSLLVCALLIVLWVRRYYSPWANLNIGPFHPGAIRILQDGGCVSIGLNGEESSFDEFLIGTGFEGMTFRPPSFDIEATAWHFYLIAPIWFYLTIFATSAALPWLKWRFSLRTLLIVVTLFALFFGAIAWSMRG